MNEIDSVVRLAQEPGGTLAQRHAAFDELVRRFQDMAYGCAYARLGDTQLAEDAAQEAFIAAYHSLRQLHDPRAFPGWLRRLVVTQCSRLTRGRQVCTQAIAAEVPVASSYGEPVAIAEEHEMRAAVVAAIAALPEHERMAMLLFAIGDHSPSEIADFLELPVATVRKRLQRARLRLQERLIDMVREDLRRRRPSKDERFAQSVRLWSAFDEAAAEGDVAILELLLVDGLNVDVRDSEGRTLLHGAVRRGHLDAVELLLRQGADAGARDNAGRTALELADEMGRTEIAELLRQHSVRV